MSRARARSRALAGTVLAIAGACSNGGTRTPEATPAPASPTAARGARTPLAPGASTIAARDYIGPAACGECHPEQHAQWQQSLHRVMNATADGEAVIGAVDRPLRYRGRRDRDDARRGRLRDDVRARRDDGALPGDAHDRAPRAAGVRRRCRSARAAAGSPEAAGDEVRLPVGWWPRRGGWYPQPYFDPWLGEDDLDVYVPVREPWAERCPWCHSTYPFEQRIARAAGRAIGHGFEQHFVAAAGGERLATRAQVSTGISCESCHLGGRAHADGGPIHFVPIGAEAKPGAPIPTTFAAERRDARIVNTV